jgi:carbon monoxide dehydrogenase subunit G
MPRAQRSVRIARPVEEVFAFFTDPANETRWRGSQVKEFTATGPVAVGTRIHQVVAGPMGRGIDADIEVTDLEPNASYAFRGVAGPVRPEGEYRFHPEGAETEVTFTLDAPLSGIKKLLMQSNVQKAMEAEMGALDTAKALLET